MGTPLADLAKIVDGRLFGDGTIEIDEGEQRAIMQAVQPVTGFIIDLKSIQLVRRKN